jgi:GNAT superfamily N-acetyltransferase
LRPAWRGKGIGTAALGHMEKRLREIAANHPQDEPRYFQTWPVYQKHVATERLLRRHGYQGVRNSFDMVRPTMDDIPECPLPDGVEFRPVEESHLRAIWGANVEAFRDHWNYIARAESAFEAWAHAPFWKKELSAIAWDGDECVGTVLAQVSEEEIQKLGRRRIWTESIAVRRPWRKRGVARAMMAECLRLGRDAGYVEAALGVDAENLTGALRIYEAMGYRVTKQGTTFRKVMVE